MADGKERGRSHYGSAPSVCVFNDDKVRDAPQGMNEARGVEKNVGKDTKKLFQITEAAHACGLSRSTLVRMEERGLLLLCPSGGEIGL